MPGVVAIVDDGIAGGEAAPDVGAGQQVQVLGMLGGLDGFAGQVAGGMGVLPAFNLLVKPRVGHLALEQAGAGHQDGVVFFAAEIIGLGSLGPGVFQIAAVEVEQAAVLEHAADPVMMMVVGVNLLRLLEVGEGFLAVALVLIAITGGGTLLPRSGLVVDFAGIFALALAATFRLHVNLAADL